MMWARPPFVFGALVSYPNGTRLTYVTVEQQESKPKTNEEELSPGLFGPFKFAKENMDGSFVYFFYIMRSNLIPFPSLLMSLLSLSLLTVPDISSLLSCLASRQVLVTPVLG